METDTPADWGGENKKIGGRSFGLHLHQLPRVVNNAQSVAARPNVAAGASVINLVFLVQLYATVFAINSFYEYL